MVDNNREILAAALSAHVSELRLFWRETGLSCRWLVPDAEHCYVDEEAVRYLEKFREKAETVIVSADVRRQWIEKSTPLLENDEIGTTPFPLRTLTWLLRVVESPHREDLSTDSWNLYLWSVRLHDLPSRIQRRLANFLEMPDKQAILDFDTLVGKFVQALDVVYPKTRDEVEKLDHIMLNKQFDRLRRFRNLIFCGVANIGKANISKRLIQNWKAMTGREIGMHCVTAFHPSLSYGDMVERRIQGDGNVRSPLDNCAPRVITSHLSEAQYFFDPFTNDNIQEGLLVTLCRNAAYHPDKDFVFMIDNIDAAPLEKVLGEVSHMLDSFARVPWKNGEDGAPGAWNLDAPGARTIRLSQSGRLFFMPANVYILGTANESGLFEDHIDDHLFQTFAIEYLSPKNEEELRGLMLHRRSREAFARLEEYANYSADLWSRINAILIRVGGHKNVIGYGPLLSMCEEILQSSDVLDANRLVLGTWRYRMMPIVRVKMEALLRGDASHRAALNDLIEVLNNSWLRMHVEIEGLPSTEALYMTFDSDILL